MSSWSVQDAEARFGELLETCLQEGPQIVTAQGAETAVLLPIEEWRPMGGLVRPVGGPTLRDLLLADEPRFDLTFPIDMGFVAGRSQISNDGSP